MTYLIPARTRRIPGDSHACHIEQDGAALCGAVLGEPYRESQFSSVMLTTSARPVSVRRRRHKWRY